MLTVALPIALFFLILLLVAYLWALAKVYSKDLRSLNDTFNRTLTMDAREAESELEDQAVRWEKRLEEEKKKNYEAMSSLTKNYMDTLLRFQEKHKSSSRVFQTLVTDAIPTIVARAHLRENEEDGREAARWLYLIHCLGAWTPDPKDARILALGQRTVGLTPRDVDEIVAKIASSREVPLDENTEVTDLLQAWLLGSGPGSEEKVSVSVG